MRKIEQQMNNAIATLEHGAKWNSSNTMVEVFNGVIAEIGEGFIKLHDGGLQSNTTKSRLNAILAENGLPNERVFQKDFAWFVRLNDGTTIPFFSGMRLN